MDSTVKVAKKYPEYLCSSMPPATSASTNLATYSGRFYEGRYIQGADRRQDVEDRRAGLHRLLSDPGSDLRHQRDHARRADGQPEHQGEDHLGELWFDPGKEADAAKALLDQGADVIMQHTDSPAAMQTAAARNAFAFGQDSDMIKFGPKTQLTAITNNWAPYYIERTKLALDGKWNTGDVWGGLNSKFVVMAPYTNMPDDVKKMAMDTEAAISSRHAASVQVPGRRAGRQDRRMQGRRESRRRPDPRHGLLRQGRRRQGSGEVAHARCNLAVEAGIAGPLHRHGLPSPSNSDVTAMRRESSIELLRSFALAMTWL